MPSPFPGMDPYLENPDDWRGFHTSFIAHLAGSLNQQLPREFAAKIEERLYVVQDERDVFAGISLRWKVPRRRENITDEKVTARDGGSAGTTVADPPEFLRVEPLTIRERFIEIIAVRGKKQVVTVIEVLSPSNKVGAGRQTYLRKQRAVLKSEVNLVEIDLLRGGTPTAAIPLTGLRLRPPFDFLVCLNRADQRTRVAYWPFTLHERLPRIFIPLLSGEPDIVEDLQTIFSETYDRGAFDRTIEYDQPLTPTLRAEDAAWAESLLRPAA